MMNDWSYSRKLPEGVCMLVQRVCVTECMHTFQCFSASKSGFIGSKQLPY
jgi:hypothetical protein